MTIGSIVPILGPSLDRLPACAEGAGLEPEPVAKPVASIVTRASRLEISPSALLKLGKAKYEPVQGRCSGALLVLTRDSPQLDVLKESLCNQGVRRALGALPERERRILELRFGFEGEPWTLEAIGHELDLTRERVRQLEAQALARLAALRDLAAVSAN